MTKIRDWKMKRKKLFLCILGIWGIVLTSCETKEDTQEQDTSGIPDVVSSMVSDSDYNLMVVANSNRIEDEDEFARTFIHMCQDNSFHTTRFSTDIRGYPAELNISVYLSRRDIEEKKEPFCKIEFKTDDFSKDYNIKENPDKFTLYLDGKEIEFY